MIKFVIYSDNNNAGDNNRYVWDGTYYFKKHERKGEWYKVTEPQQPLYPVSIKDDVPAYRSLRRLPRYANRPGIEWEINFLRELTYTSSGFDDVEFNGKIYHIDKGCYLTCDEDGQVFQFNAKPFYCPTIKRWSAAKATHMLKHLDTIDPSSVSEPLPALHFVHKPRSIRNNMVSMDITVILILNAIGAEDPVEISGFSEFVLKDMFSRLKLTARIESYKGNSYRFHVSEINHVR
tara:strand:- start:6697 stop:7401 length:705 start_codon:yes stop_codon:yes gene_type:complete